jgi:hypothetical protein
MSAQGKYFLTKDVILRTFNILDLQFASTSQEIVNIIQGIYLLPPAKSRKVMNALRAQLYVDFLFMPAIYGGIFLLCMQVARKMSLEFGENFFAALAWLQIVSLLCDVFENVYLLNKLHPHLKVSATRTHKIFQCVVAIKWGVSLFASVCSIAALFFFWLAGRYSVSTLPYLLVICVELGLFVVLGKTTSKKLKPVIEDLKH